MSFQFLVGGTLGPPKGWSLLDEFLVTPLLGHNLG